MAYSLKYATVESTAPGYKSPASYGGSGVVKYGASHAAQVQEIMSIPLQFEAPAGRRLTRCSTFNAGSRCEICKRDCHVPL